MVSPQILRSSAVDILKFYADRIKFNPRLNQLRIEDISEGSEASLIQASLSALGDDNRGISVPEGKYEFIVESDKAERIASDLSAAGVNFQGRASLRNLGAPAVTAR